MHGTVFSMTALLITASCYWHQIWNYVISDFISPYFKYREVLRIDYFVTVSSLMQVYPFGGANYADSIHLDPSEKEDAQSSLNYSLKQGYGSCIFISVLFPSLLLLNMHNPFCCFYVFICAIYLFFNVISMSVSWQNRIHPPPTFGSSSNLEALALQKNKNNIEDGGSAMSVTPYFR